MGVIEDLKRDFYDRITDENKKLLIFVAYSVDSVCTYKIIQDLFKHRNFLYAVFYVSTKNEFKQTFLKHSQTEFDSILLINFGASIDIINFLDIEDNDNRVFYILDSQRPIHINNYYNTKQVQILSFMEDHDVPEFEDLFNDDEEDEDDDGGEDEIAENDDENDSELNNSSAKRKRYDPEYLLKRREKREWKKRREEIMLEYEKYVYHGTTSSIVIYEMAYLIGEHNSQMLWAAIVGHTSQYLLNLISREMYEKYIGSLANHLTNLAQIRRANTEHLHEIIIKFSNELNLWLYRHWALKDAIYSTPTTVAAFGLCRRHDKRLMDFLAFLGIPLIQYEENYSAMDHKISSVLVDLFNEHCEKYNISKTDLFLPSFVGRYGYNTLLSAVDAAFVVISILENEEKRDGETVFELKFERAVNFLNIDDKTYIDKGLQMSMRNIRALQSFVKGVVEKRSYAVRDNFLEVEIQKTLFSNLCTPIIQGILARYLLEAICVNNYKLGKHRDTKKLPFILTTRLLVEDQKFVLYGIPPIKMDKGKNAFGQIFEHAVHSVRTNIEQHSLNPCRIDIYETDKPRIFNKINDIFS